jgi:hypothetical protein
MTAQRHTLRRWVSETLLAAVLLVGLAGLFEWALR